MKELTLVMEQYDTMDESLFVTWSEKDNIQKLLSVFEADASDALNCALEYTYVLEFVDNNDAYVNKAPFFWSEVIKSLRYALVMKTARLFDESKDAVGIMKIFKVYEQSCYGRKAKLELSTAKNGYQSMKKWIDEIHTLRDKVFAHNDRRAYNFWKLPQESNASELEYEGEIWDHFVEVLQWAKNTILILRKISGDCWPIGIEAINDLDGLI